VPIRQRCLTILALTATLTLGLATAAIPNATAATPGCTLASTNGTVTRTLGTRTYQLHVPQGLTGTQVPLLLSLPGAFSNGSLQESNTLWSSFADTNNFIVAYPNEDPMMGGVWNPYVSNSPDLAFISSVVDDVSNHWCIDPHHVHVDGWSNGAVMSQRVACDLAAKFASATSYAGGTPTASGAACRPSRPISVFLLAGQFDFTITDLAANTNEWVGYDGCSTTPAHETDQYGSTNTYSCAAGTSVLSRTVNNTSHNWPSGAQGQDQRTRMWSFFMANPLP
jgi:polyhydroxybutyrate depolymerase